MRKNTSKENVENLIRQIGNEALQSVIEKHKRRLYDHSQRAHVATNRSWPLRRIYLVSLDQFADSRVIIAKLETLSTPAGMCPE